MKTEERSVVAKGWDSGEELTAEGFREIRGGGMKLIYILICGGGYATVCIFQNSQNRTLKKVSFTVCKLYFNL